MQKFQFEYEDQVSIWKKEKSDLQQRVQELTAYGERIRFESQEQISNFKEKYNDYKTKLKKANANIQTLTTRIAKYELAIVADKQIGRVDSIRGALRAAGIAPRQGLRSSEGALSPGVIGQPMSDFNMAGGRPRKSCGRTSA